MMFGGLVKGSKQFDVLISIEGSPSNEIFKLTTPMTLSDIVVASRLKI